LSPALIARGIIIQVKHSLINSLIIAVAERHIPKCKDIVNKPKPPPRLRNQDVAQSIEIHKEDSYSPNKTPSRPKTASSYASGGGGSAGLQLNSTSSN
jgi:hypothetical protein